MAIRTNASNVNQTNGASKPELQPMFPNHQIPNPHYVHPTMPVPNGNGYVVAAIPQQLFERLQMSGFHNTTPVLYSQDQQAVNWFLSTVQQLRLPVQATHLGLFTTIIHAHGNYGNTQLQGVYQPPMPQPQQHGFVAGQPDSGHRQLCVSGIQITSDVIQEYFKRQFDLRPELTAFAQMLFKFMLTSDPTFGASEHRLNSPQAIGDICNSWIRKMSEHDCAYLWFDALFLKALKLTRHFGGSARQLDPIVDKDKMVEGAEWEIGGVVLTTGVHNALAIQFTTALYSTVDFIQASMFKDKITNGVFEFMYGHGFFLNSIDWQQGINFLNEIYEYVDEITDLSTRLPIACDPTVMANPTEMAMLQKRREVAMQEYVSFLFKQVCSIQALTLHDRKEDRKPNYAEEWETWATSMNNGTLPMFQDLLNKVLRIQSEPSQVLGFLALYLRKLHDTGLHQPL